MQQQILEQVSQITLRLAEIAQEGYSVTEITKIWVDLPTGDLDGTSDLEAATKCILEVSNLVDKRYADLPINLKVAKKLKLMASLLDLKADQLNSLYK